MSVKLRISGARRAMHEPGDRPSLGRHVAPQPADLDPGQRGAFLQKPERGRDRFPVGAHDHIGDRFGAERPQHRRPLRC